MMHTIDHDRWQTVLERGVDPSFFYAVITTGIFCKTTCPSRRPKPENVVFFESCEAAIKAGYRACQRCQPQTDHLDISSRLQHAYQRLLSEDPAPTLSVLALEADMSPSHFQKRFKAQFGVSPKAVAKTARTQRLKTALKQEPTVTDAIYAAGFNAPSNAYQTAEDSLGMPLKQWRDGGAGEQIYYATMQSSLGWVLVAQTHRGICAIELGDNAETLTQKLGSLFPKADLKPADTNFQETLERVLDLVETPSQAPARLPLDMQGTAFQMRVWQALRAIPPGETISYAALAQKIGQPTAARAVARACASNKIALAIPCHRVVRGDGSLSGYRWGADRKRRILEREKQIKAS